MKDMFVYECSQMLELFLLTLTHTDRQLGLDAQSRNEPVSENKNRLAHKCVWYRLWLDHEKNKNLLIINDSLFVKCIYVSFSLPWSQELLPSLKLLQINFLQHLSFSFCASVV